MMKILLIIVFLFALNGNLYAQVSVGNTAITGVAIIDANHHTPLSDQTLLISNHIIIDIFPDGQKPIPDSFNILRMKGKYILPGLIDAHVHLATDPSGEDNRAHTLDVLKRMLYSGITTVRDMAGDARTLASLSRDALVDDIPSPNIYYSALMAGPVFFSDSRTAATTKGGINGKMPYMLAVTDSTDLVLAVAEAKGTGATGIKLYANLSAELVNKIVHEAKRQKILVWGHAWLDDAKPTDVVNAGVNPISHSELLLADKLESIPLSWKNKKHTKEFWDDSLPDLNSLFELMKKNNTILDATMSAYKSREKEDSFLQYQFEIEKRITERAYKAGVKICAGTDDNQEGFVQDEMKLMVRDAAFSNIDAIVSATLNGAEALHLNNTRGTIEKNKIADLIILDKNPLEDIDNIDAVILIMKGGKIFLE